MGQREDLRGGQIAEKKAGEEEDSKWVWDRDQEPGPQNADPASALRPPTWGMQLLFHMRAEFI